VAQYAQERLLHGVFGVGGVAQNGVSHPVEGCCVLAHQGRERILFRVLASFVAHSLVCDFHPT
jgi:hypothetical protein